MVWGAFKIREKIFKFIAHVFPTERIVDSHCLYLLWRLFFYGLRPEKPFLMRTKYYSLYAHPKRGNLSRTVARRAVWERLQTHLILERLKPGMTFIDIGANFGHYALLASNRVGKKGKVLAFEPEPQVFSQLKESVSLLKHDNILIFQAALGRTNDKINLYIDMKNAGGHSLVPANLITLKETLPVECFRLDDLLKKLKIKSVDMIKLDAQGAEGQIFEGCFSMIKKNRPIIFCEYEPKSLLNMGSDPRSFLEQFFSLGYKLFYFDKKYAKELKPILSPDSYLPNEKYDLLMTI